jgi:hypothetical protein
MNHSHRSETVLAIYPTTRGLGYVVMRSPLSPVDWGIRGARTKQKNAKCLEKVSALIDAHQPDAIVLEDPTAPGANRSERIRHLSLAIARLADGQSVEVHVYPRSRVNEFFKEFGARTRHEVAVVIAKQVTALERFLPSRRKVWENESPRMSIFNAAALAMTFFGTLDR